MGSGEDLEEILEHLHLDFWTKLYNLSTEDLYEILSTLTSSLSKKELISLILNSEVLGARKLMRALESKHPDLFKMILNEPEKESEMRCPVEYWLKESLDCDLVEFEVPYPSKRTKTKRYIDVVGYDSYNEIIYTIEMKAKPSKRSIDSAFSQARDYGLCSDYVYVAISPLVFMKYHNDIDRKVSNNKRRIGVLIVDKGKVLEEYASPKSYKKDKEKYRQLQEYLESKLERTFRG